MGELAARLNREEKDIDASPVSPLQLAGLVRRIADGTLSSKTAREVLDELWKSDVTVQLTGSEGVAAIGSVDAVIESKGLRQITDSGAIEKLIDDVLAANPKSVEEFRAGKEKAFNALVGQVMKATKGKANPQQVNDLLRSKLV
jgi:aspartyl-tRNA(Asn)/glutamyl-tRNA(Gln) amidotransferase subunit B